MTFNPRPCPHCAGTSFHVIPGVQLEAHASPAIFGLAEAIKIKNKQPRWGFTIVACAQCGRTETFTTDVAKLASVFPTSQMVTSNRPA